jgi:two-component system chemotaxis response regulator CheB
MPIRVLVVDDSGFFRRRLTEILNADPLLEVIDTAANGAEGVEKVSAIKPDVVTMDVEMPVMDGISAVRRIMATTPTPVLMFSSLTQEGAKATLDALEAGAADFLPKRLEDIAGDQNEAKRLLCQRVRAIARKAPVARPPAAAREPGVSGAPRPVAGAPVPKRWAPQRRGDYRLVAIGTSTGGPVALQEVLSKLPASFPLPLLLVQHMPATFTPAFAQRLDQHCAIAIREAKDGDRLDPGTALLAPGGRQMVVENRNGAAVVRIRDSKPEEHYRPSVDVSFNSCAEVFPGKVLAIVMTGMGADGREGARKLKAGGATVWAQDEHSCVVYGMPMAVVEAGLVDAVLPLAEIGTSLAREG